MFAIMLIPAFIFASCAAEDPEVNDEIENELPIHEQEEIFDEETYQPEEEEMSEEEIQKREDMQRMLEQLQATGEE